MKTLSFKYFTALAILSVFTLNGAISFAMMPSESDGDSIHSQALPSVEVNLHVLGALRQSVHGEEQEKQEISLDEKKRKAASKKKARHTVVPKKKALQPVKAPMVSESEKAHSPAKAEALPMLAPADHEKSMNTPKEPEKPISKIPAQVELKKLAPTAPAAPAEAVQPISKVPAMMATANAATSQEKKMDRPAAAPSHDSDAMIPFPKGGIAPSSPAPAEMSAPLSSAPLPAIQGGIPAAPVKEDGVVPTVPSVPSLPAAPVPSTTPPSTQSSVQQDKKGFLSRILGSKEAPTIEAPSKPAEEVSGPAKALSVQSIGGATAAPAPEAPPSEADVPALPSLPGANSGGAVTPSDLPPVVDNSKENANLSSLSFLPGEVTITSQHSNLLNQLVADLAAHPDHKLKVVAYTASDAQNDTKVRRIALQRVIGIRKHLIGMGVNPMQINVQALASADNTKTSDAQLENVDFELVPMGVNH